MSRRVEAAAWVLLVVVCVVLTFVVRTVRVGLPSDVVLVLDFHATYTRLGWRPLVFLVAAIGIAAWSLRRPCRTPAVAAVRSIGGR